MVFHDISGLYLKYKLPYYITKITKVYTTIASHKQLHVPEFVLKLSC